MSILSVSIFKTTEIIEQSGRGLRIVAGPQGSTESAITIQNADNVDGEIICTPAVGVTLTYQGISHNSLHLTLAAKTSDIVNYDLILTPLNFIPAGSELVTLISNDPNTYLNADC